MIKILIGLFTFYLQLISASNEIGIRSKVTSEYQALKTGDVISKIVGESFEIYCRADQRFNVCIFKWEEENTENCIFIDNVYPWNCPGEMKRIDDKCIIRISSFDTLKHTGKWECVLVHNEDHINVTDDLTLSMVTLIGAQAQVDMTSVTLGTSDSADLACRTSSQVYPPLEDNRLFKWKINGNVNYDNAYVLSEDKSDCIKASENDYENKCNIQSNLRYTADKSDSEISCYAQQTDTFGDILHSNEQFIDVIIESNGISQLSSGIKAAIAITVIFLILIIIALILFLAWYFGWCCWKDRQKKSEKQELKVNDQPTENQFTNAERPTTIQESFFVHPMEEFMVKPKYQEWPVPFQDMQGYRNSLEDMNSLIQPPEDELLVYKWEGFGRPYSITGSLSSLESFGHVDDLDLSSTLQFLEGQAVLPLNTTSTSITTSTLSEVDSEDLSSSAQADYYSIPHQTFTDSWV